MKTISVKEYADAAGISTTTVYKQMQPGGRLEKYAAGTDQHRRIDAAALEDLPKPEPETAPEAGEIAALRAKLEAAEKTADDLRDMIELLRDQITAKDRQIADQARALVQEQQLQLRALLQKPQDGPEGADPAPEYKRSIFGLYKKNR